MGFLSRALGSGGGGARGTASVQPVDNALPDREWYAASERVFENTIGQHFGSPETMAAPGREHYNHQNFAVAMLFFGKAVDMLQTAYCFSQMANRQPSAADAWIVDGYVSAIGAGLSMHPQAPVGESARKSIGLLNSIAGECERVGLPGKLYRDAADGISWEARSQLS